jgi:hypothetical protein
MGFHNTTSKKETEVIYKRVGFGKIAYIRFNETKQKYLNHLVIVSIF